MQHLTGAASFHVGNLRNKSSYFAYFTTMKVDTPSQTALYMALFRALESARPPHSRLFYDPHAVSFLPPSYRFLTRLSAVPVARRMIYRTIQRRIPGALSSGIARTRYIDDQLQLAIRDGAQQVILLGAGFDTRAQRLPALSPLSVIEIDHPDTAMAKMKVLQRKARQLPENTSYLQIDFNRQSLEDLAEQYRIDYSLKTVLIWEGVSNYLSPDAVAQTFRFAANFAEGSRLIFTYIHEAVLSTPGVFHGAEKLLNDLAAIGEQWTFGLRPEALQDYLRPFGFTLFEDAGAEDYRRQYLPELPEKGYEFYRVAVAVRDVS